MMKIDNRTFLDDGTVLCQEAAIVEMLYNDLSLDTVIAEPSYDIELYNKTDRYLDTNFGKIETASNAQYTKTNWFEYWLTPEPYKSLDIETYIRERCQNEEQLARVEEELVLYKERNMLPVLRHLVYLTDHWRQQKIVWGVGRGSSVGSLILYLIGINRINPLDFGLGIEEFLK